MMITIQLDLQISGAVYMGLDWKTHWHGCCPPTLLTGRYIQVRECLKKKDHVSIMIPRFPTFSSHFSNVFCVLAIHSQHECESMAEVLGQGRSIHLDLAVLDGAYHIWLVVDLALWKIWVSWDDDIPNIVYIIYYSHFFSKVFQTTNQIYACVYIYTFMYAHEIIPVVVPKYFDHVMVTQKMDRDMGIQNLILRLTKIWLKFHQFH